ncbi:MAG: TetR/AcrR family transcriptional regulator [Oscillospiraceae bacterium]
MANQIKGVYEEVIEIAKQEFLENGFQKASLRTIATKANTTTGSIYTRFGDKEGLFSAIVEPTATELIAMFTQIQQAFCQFSEEQQQKLVGEYASDNLDSMIDYMYEHFTDCKLLLEYAEDTKYADFSNRFVEIEEEYTQKYIAYLGCSILGNKKMDYDIIHMISTAYFESFFEIIRHNMEIEKAKSYFKVLGEYHLAGFKSIFHLN